jgi:hypothetical protein
MRVAFLVLNHRQPEQLVRLLGALRSQLPDSPVVIHHDGSRVEIPEALVEPFDNVHLLQSGRRIFWGDSSITDVCCWAMTWMHENLEFDWMVLLSAQDYPIKPLAGLADDLARDGADAVFQSKLISQLPTMHERIVMRQRYFYQYRPARVVRPESRFGSVTASLRRRTRNLVGALNIAQPLFKLYRLPDGMPYRVGWRAYKTPFSSDWPCWKGSQWFALSRGALDYTLTYLADHPEYVDYYRRTMVPDESMLATVVLNAPHLRVSRRDVTYTRWSGPREHPDIFQAADLPELTAVPQYFARKFDIYADAGILDALDQLITQDARPMEHS